MRNEEHVPENSKDGIVVFENSIRNAYKESCFDDTGAVYGKTYYYRFFTYSDKGVENNDFNFKKILFKKVPEFSAADWNVIQSVVQEGNASDFWHIGDTKTVHINPCEDMTGGDVEFMIAGFDIPRVSQGEYGTLKTLPAGEHNICLIQKKFSEGLKTNQLWTEGMNASNTCFFYYWHSGNSKIAAALTSDIPVGCMLDTVEGVDKNVQVTHTSKFNFLTAWELGYSETGVDANNKRVPVFTDINSKAFGKEYWTLCAEKGRDYVAGKNNGSGLYCNYPKTCRIDGTYGNSTNFYMNSGARYTDYIRVKCFIG